MRLLHGRLDKSCRAVLPFWFRPESRVLVGTSVQDAFRSGLEADDEVVDP